MVTTAPEPAQGLTISDLARRTGLTAATIRAWEGRYGFPVPARRASGHRRYAEADVALVGDVLRRRQAGVRLDAAIADAVGSRAVHATATTSVFAELRRTHPHLAPQRLRKSTLLALTWAIEDECCARAQSPRLFGAFQQARFFDRARDRWQELARTSRTTVAFADFDAAASTTAAVSTVHLPEEAPMRREWSVVCDSPDHVAALAAWELPGQSHVPDRDRVFESLWTLEPAAVRDAARICAQLTDVLAPGLGHDWSGLDQPATEPSPDLRAGSLMFQRLVAYLDSGRR